MSRARARPRPQPRVTSSPAPQPAPAVVPYRVATAYALAALCFVVYLTNLRPMGAWDSVPARLLPFSILRQGNLDLDEFAWLRRLNPSPYFLRQTPNGHWMSRYPIGVPVVVTPMYIPVTWWLQHAQVDDDDVRFRLASAAMERIAAASIAATSVFFVFLAATTMASRRTAMFTALAYGLASSTWTVSSQALWQHGLAELGLAGLTFCLMAPDDRRHALGAGAFAALAVLARPTMGIFALVGLVFMWRERRSRLFSFLALPAVGAGLLLAYNVRLLNIATGGYQRGVFTAPRIWRFLGLLLSPNRGLFIYTPAALLALPTMVRPQRGLPRWLRYAPFGLAGYLLLYSAWIGWWGGHCYGPRFLTDALPVITLCAIPVARHLWESRSGRALVLTLVLWGAGVQAVGVYYDDNAWNAMPASVDTQPLRVWDWSDLQIVRAWHSGWHGSELGPLLWQALVHPQPAYLRRLDGEDLAASLSTADSLPLHYTRQSPGRLHLQVTNQGRVTWPVYSDYGYLQIWIVYRWWANGTVVPGEGGFIHLPRNLPPQESLELSARIDAPGPGNYELELIVAQALDMTQGISSADTLRVPVQVR